MFKGFFSAMLLVTGFLIVLPALVLWAAGGADWLDRLQMMMPSM
jgi:hypothetical protein